MHLRIKKRRTKHITVDILLLLPFFELMVFELLSKKGYMESEANFIMSICSICRLIISIYYIFLRKSYWSYTAMGFAVFIISENIVSTLNGSIYINYFIGSFTTVGLCLLCSALIRKSYKNYIDACITLFGALSIINAIQCYAMPGGFFGAYYKESAVYLLGSKNTCFFFYAVFLYFLLYDEALEKKRFRLSTLFIMLFLIGATYVSDAMNAFVMLCMAFVYYCMIALGTKVYKIFNIKYLLSTVTIVAVFILIPELRGIFKPILNMIGRDTTVTGRDVLWLQAITKFQKNPLIGNGILTEYVLETGVIADHAHCHYLDVLAKYGVITFFSFVLTIVCVIRKAVLRKKHVKRMLALDCVFLGLFLLHSIIDHLELFNFIVILISIELLPVDCVPLAKLKPMYKMAFSDRTSTWQMVTVRTKEKDYFA